MGEYSLTIDSKLINHSWYREFISTLSLNNSSQLNALRELFNVSTLTDLKFHTSIL
jgi:hypothetical protein